VSEVGPIDDGFLARYMEAVTDQIQRGYELTTAEKLVIAVQALRDIANPIRRLRRLADEQGDKLDGGTAVRLSQDCTYLKGMAISALGEIGLNP
jgi:hypothetical protein